MDLSTLLSDIDISVRLSNICKTAQIKTLDELFNLDYNTLMSFRGLGKKTLEEINYLRVKFGLEPLTYKQKIEPSKIISHRKNVKYSVDQITSIPYKILIKIKISEINLSNKLVYALERLNVKIVEDIIRSDITPDKLLSQRSVGLKTTTEYAYFYNKLQEIVPKNITVHSNKIKGIDLLQNKKLTDITLSFTLYNALSNLGVYKLKDILDLNITLPKLLNEIGLRSKQAREFSDLLEKLKKENNYLTLDFPELFSKKVSCFDISKLPEKFQDMCVDFFILPVYLERFFKNNQIKVFKDLGLKEEKQFIGINPYIKEKINSLIQQLQKGEFYEDILPRDPHYFPIWVDKFIENLNKRNSEIFKMRFGYYDNIYTFEEIGKRVNITRERVRQIINNLTKNFRRKFSLGLKNVEIEFKEKIISNFSPLTEKEIFRKIDEDRLFVTRYPRRLYLHFLKEIFPQLLIEYNGRLLKTKFSSYEEKVELKVIKLLRERLPIVISKEKFRQFVRENSKLDIFSFVRVSLMSHRISIENKKEKIRLALKKSTFDNAVRAIFNSAMNPITISEFKKRLHFYFPNLKNFSNEDYLRARLVNHPQVYRFDTDLFGNAKHLEELCPNKDKIVDFCYREFENRKIPTAIYDLLPLISFADIKFVPKNPNFLLDAIISTDKRFVKLGRLLYSLKKWGKIELINVADQAYNILKRNKVPMYYPEIFNTIYKQRSILGISLNTILRVDKRFHNYPPGWYGLSETHEENLIYLLFHSPYIDSLIYSQQPGTTLEEIVDVLDMQDYFDVEELEEILIKDKRFIIYDDGNKKVFHRNWSTRKLITKVLKDHKNGLNLQELQWKLNDLYGFARKFSLRDIRYAISTIVNIIKIEDRYILAKEVKVSGNLKEKINAFVENNMSDKKILYNLEEMFDLFMDVTEIDEEVTLHHFRIGFEKLFKENFIEIGSDIYRRIN